MSRTLAYLCCILYACGADYQPSGGPVYVNPAAAAEQVASQKRSEATAAGLLTQTVYGFLDFTTTIGNTVMVFSPQSAPPEGGAATTTTEKAAPVIDTRPAQASAAPQDIRPSRTAPGLEGSGSGLERPSGQAGPAASSPAALSSVVEVRGGALSAPPSSVVNVVLGPQVLASKVEVKSAGFKAVSSKVEVKTGGPKAAVSSKVEVKTAWPKAVVSSKVEVLKEGFKTTASSKVEVVATPASGVVFFADRQTALPGPAREELHFSSVVEVRSSAEEPAISGNNIFFEPEYDFLSRQPSEVVDETYRVFNLKPSASKFSLRAPRPTAAKAGGAPAHKTRGGPQQQQQPTGLVTRLGGTVVKDGVTTVHETKVIGTYISGKYAQVLQSTSRVHQGSGSKPKVSPTAAQRILKTAAPSPAGKPRPQLQLDPTPDGSLRETGLPLEALFSSSSGPNLVRASRRPAGPPPSNRNSLSRFKGRGRDSQESKDSQQEPGGDEDQDAPYGGNRRSSPRAGQRQASSARHKTAPSKHGNRFGGRPTQTPELATVSVFSESSATRRYQQSSQRRGGFRPSGATAAPAAAASSSPAGDPPGGRRGYKPRVSAAPAADAPPSHTTSLYKFKLSRPGGGRWQYKTSPKPRVNIRKSEEAEAASSASSTPTPPQQQQQQQPQPRSDDGGGESHEAAAVAAAPVDVEVAPSGADREAQPVPEETLNVEISTPADFKDVYYELATIKSPYTFQVGTVKNTRFVTVTSTLERSLAGASEAVQPSEPLTENLLASTTAPLYAKEAGAALPLDSGVATLPPVGLAGDAETPPLETLTESFSTSQLLLKTHVLPVVRGGSNTTWYTLVQSYHVTRLVTAIKTLPPMELYHFVPSKTLNEFNTRLEEAGSELHLELDFGDDGNSDDGRDDDDRPAALRALRPDFDLASVGSDFDPADVDGLRLKKARGAAAPSTTTSTTPEPPSAAPALSPDQLQQLALLRFLNPGAAVAPQVVTTSRPVLRVETVWESHVLPVVNGASTGYSTISRPVGTVSRTEYEYGTSTLPVLPGLANPLFPAAPQQQQQLVVTSTPVVTQTVVTATDSKVLKLTFGAKTAYTTIFSTKVVPTVITTYVTTSIPVQPTAPAFPGYFPAPYPQFPFVG
ncbi:uncharacterized protein LOC134533986 [Bacillus rossius redtenbacheri]|uniref:uncharacterized protein LOC134533986 n=1 Tax=Bacillus rossius redtenbacheri TaxID=93214 RepID=UPI002FDE74BF